MRTHILKILPEYFEAIVSGRKRFELRQNDRGGYHEGDILLLREWDGPDFPTPRTSGFTGRAKIVRVTYVLESTQLLAPGVVALGIEVDHHAEKIMRDLLADHAASKKTEPSQEGDR